MKNDKVLNNGLVLINILSGEKKPIYICVVMIIKTSNITIFKKIKFLLKFINLLTLFCLVT